MVVLALLACGGGRVYLGEPYPSEVPLEAGQTASEDTGTGPPPDYREPGPLGVDEATLSFDGASCTMRYDRYLPQGQPPEVLVVLAHGFSRSRAYVADHGRHLASWGVAVVAPDLCTSDFWDIDHGQNGRDLAALAAAASDGLPVVFVGHSAGGLAALLASAQSPVAVGQLGLDLVDSGDLGQQAAGSVPVPAWGLLGEPDFCNEDSNGTDVYAAVADGGAIRVAGADHCDFEAPTDGLCTGFCGGGDASDPAVRAIVRAMTTAYVLWISGLDPRASEWWLPGGGPYDELVTAGAIGAL